VRRGRALGKTNGIKARCYREPKEPDGFPLGT